MVCKLCLNPLLLSSPPIELRDFLFFLFYSHSWLSINIIELHRHHLFFYKR